MALSGSFRRTLGIASIAALLTAGLIAPPAQAASASPGSINVNCSAWSMETPITTITGAKNDTFTMTETSTAIGCDIAEGSAVESSSSTSLGAGLTTTFTILAAGTFTVTDSGPVAHTFTVTLSASTDSSESEEAVEAVEAVEAPTYTMTFNANGGSCLPISGGSYSSFGARIEITGRGGASYALPSAAYCTREGYTLQGWSHSSDAIVTADENTEAGAVVTFTGNGMMYAVWAPAAGFNEITYDANVSYKDFCFPVSTTYAPNLAIRFLLGLSAVGIYDQSPRTQVVSLNADSALLEQPACSPFIFDANAYEGRGNYYFWRFLGWNTKADGTGTQYYAPSSGDSENLFKLGGEGDKRRVHLYAQWHDEPCPTVEAGTGTVAPQAFEGAQWAGCNLTGANLAGATLAGATLAGANLTGANLTGAVLSGSNLYNANLTRAILTGANMTNMTILLGATLDGVISGGITATDTPVLPTINSKEGDEGSADGDGNWKLVNGYLVGPRANLTLAKLSFMGLDGATLTGADLDGADLRGATLRGANLRGADLTIANLRGATLTGATLTGATLTNANLRGADLDGVISGGIIATAPPVLPTLNSKESVDGSADGNGNWKLVNGYLVGPRANLTGANLTDADLSGADLSGADLTGADLTGVYSGNRSKIQGEVLRGGIFVQLDNLPTLPDRWMLRNHYLIGPKAILTNANLSGSNLAGATLAGANLAGAVLTGAVLTGAVLTGANLSGADLSGAVLTDRGLDGHAIYGKPKSLPDEWVQGGDGALYYRTCVINSRVASACEIGYTGPGGGLVFYKAEKAELWGQYLEMAPKNWGVDSQIDPKKAWTTTTTQSDSTNAPTAIGMGSANTDAIIARIAAGGVSPSDYAAGLASAYASVDGLTDWFLPSKDELNAMCNYSRNPTRPRTRLCTGAQNVDFAAGAYGFASDDYWSSSQDDANYAWDQDLADGYQSDASKNDALRVRPVRAF